MDVALFHNIGRYDFIRHDYYNVP